jgi:hypothetical protein
VRARGDGAPRVVDAARDEERHATRMLAAIAGDEARHAELARRLDTWLLGQLDEDARAEVAAARRTAVRTLASALRPPPIRPRSSPSACRRRARPRSCAPGSRRPVVANGLSLAAASARA